LVENKIHFPHRKKTTGDPSVAAGLTWIWRPILMIACSPLDTGQTDVITDEHDP